MESFARVAAVGAICYESVRDPHVISSSIAAIRPFNRQAPEVRGLINIAEHVSHMERPLQRPNLLNGSVCDATRAPGDIVEQPWMKSAQAE